uniref:Uncharacterized protein n=1 Tax=Siphoviridae sp. ctyg07 TaxID=2825747 RepID=A0A8S5VCI4_9CAUD|nr:MAG TPA: hypothetical protein [Caudoviricetes sp.]DAG04398.1 MAG TPA: hypothetical protein [Siphoviridae sp. ctyg07]DAS66824.1 MAG TPA: hypothetical protein [Bacteriophage sp.]DAF05546.1 MAG TPA: hypothetical protein [Caudoviricetes sp.]DAK22642.1 MAG TPA: hypothetical protein [Caudoviricetes sp.]
MSLVSQLLERLPHEPWSLYRANELGGDQWFGYSHDSERLNEELDRLALLIKASATNKATLKDSEMMPRPAKANSVSVVSSNDTAGVAALFASLG